MSSHPPNRSDEDSPQDRSATKSKPKTQNPTLKTQNSKLCFVCVGAGHGSRFGGDKLSQLIGDRMVFAVVLEALETARPSAGVVVVVAPDDLSMWRDRLGRGFPRARFVAGGARRSLSVRAGVNAAVGLGADVVAIHDAARPLVNPHDVQRVVRGLGEWDGAILTAPVSDTIKRIDGDDSVAETVDRENLRFALTPQVFRVASLRGAWEETGDVGEWTDEAALLENSGMRVRCIDAEHPNPKLTIPSDLVMIRVLAGVAP